MFAYVISTACLPLQKLWHGKPSPQLEQALPAREWGKRTHDADWGRVSNQIEEIIVFPLKFRQMVKPHRRYFQKLPSFVLKVARNNSSKSCAGNSNHDKLLESPKLRHPSSKASVVETPFFFWLSWHCNHPERPFSFKNWKGCHRQIVIYTYTIHIYIYFHDIALFNSTGGPTRLK